MHTAHMSDCSPVPHWCTRQLLWSAAIIALMHDQRNAEWQPQWMRWRRRRRRLWTAAYGTTNWLMRWLSFVSFRFDSFAIEIGQMRAPIDDALPLCCIGNNCERWYGNFTIDGERERGSERRYRKKRKENHKLRFVAKTEFVVSAHHLQSFVVVQHLCKILQSTWQQHNWDDNDSEKKNRKQQTETHPPN